MFKEYNPNPSGLNVGDCVIRAISMLFGISWDEAYLKMVTHGFLMKDMPSANRVWAEFLRQHSYKRFIIPDTCPDCYTVADFCNDHPTGKYLLGTGSHVLAVIDGDHYDSWDSSKEVPIYFWRRNGL